MSSKKGVSASSSLVIIIIGLAFTVLMLVLLNSGEPEKIITRENCGTTVDRMDFFNRAGLPIDDEDLNCPIVTITIDDNKDNEENSRIMANAMYDCATQFRRGKKQLFTNDGVYCSVCYLFDVDTPVEGFYGYLLKTTVPESGGEEETYHEYMQGFRTVGAEKILKNLNSNKVHTLSDDGSTLTETNVGTPPLREIENMDVPEGDYALIFIYARGQEHFKKVWKHVTAQSSEGKAGLAAGGVSFLTITGSGVIAAYIFTGGAVTGPVGWVIIGGAVIAAGTIFITAEAITYHLSGDTPPEHASFFVFRKWDDRAADRLADELECDYIAQ